MKSGHGDVKKCWELLEEAERNKLIRLKKTRNGVIAKSLKDNSQTTFHIGERAIHEIRRYVNKLNHEGNKCSI